MTTPAELRRVALREQLEMVDTLEEAEDLVVDLIAQVSVRLSEVMGLMNVYLDWTAGRSTPPL